MLEKLKKEHPKARHFVYAYRYLNDMEQIVEGFSDDGEPKGTSGFPTLKVIAGKRLINCALITVRYFGGTLLGTGGLVRAYSDAANLAIKQASLEPYIKMLTQQIEIEYALSSKAEYLADTNRINITQRSFHQDGITLTCIASKDDLDSFVLLLEQLQ